MKTFKFKMDKILDYRRNNENLIKEKYWQKNNKYKNEKQKLSNLKTKYEILKQENNFIMNKDVLKQKQIYQYSQFLEDKINLQENTVNVCLKELEEIKKTLIEAHKDRKVIEKLKENAYEKHTKELNKLEQKNMDEIASRIYKKTI